MPKAPWTGYGRFCPLARALDVVGDRWTLVIMQEVLKRPSRYSHLSRRLPGISSTLLAERLRKLESAGVVRRRAGAIGEGVVYEATERGLALDDALQALRRWGVEFLTDPTADGAERQAFDVHYVDGIGTLDDAEFGLIVDGNPTTLRFSEGYLEQTPDEPRCAELVVTTTATFMDRWAAGEVNWDQGVAAGEVILSGEVDAWPRWLAATGYLLRYDGEPADA
jgi:DNA-binding HxlR family transcriptional regulator